MGRYHEELTRRFLIGVRQEAPANARRPTHPRRESIRVRPSKSKPASMENGMSHPGEILARHLQELGLTASDLARDIDVPVNRVTAILNGQRGVTADTALRLGHWFGVQPEDWLELQTQYELSLARRAAGARIKSLPSLADRQRD
ncbi:HigA family addiction module antitoxin [Methylocystis sp. SC2]|uniref:HigA family addiction module antitoxin n=1 Tax=Methylocystis sp. (strain SC2) TaxID=187303 RepID=UPI00027AF528|nr:HigA family addiction module antitoxin [Methylocystis sp. SC2]CCJ09052.1 Plasmid maintenance system antidote protein, XRE family [Methylocystis sp. SC2]